MTFPTAGSTVYYNTEGELLGWDAPDYGDPYDAYDSEDFDHWDEAPSFDSVEECEAAGLHAQDGNGTGVDGHYACYYCEAVFELPASD